MAYIKIRIRGDTKENWANSNPILEERELAVEINRQSAAPWKLKIGDGKTPWNNLGYSFDYDAVNNVYIKTHSDYLDVRQMHQTISEAIQTTTDSIDASLSEIQSAQIVVLDAQQNVVEMHDELLATINGALIQSTQEMLNEIKRYLQEINEAKEGIVLNIAAGDASSFDVQNIDGGTAVTVDNYSYETGNALSILN